MEDTHLESLRREPPPLFAGRLRSTLREQDASASNADRPRLKAVAASVMVVAGLAAMLTVPSVRASAQSFLALFRAVNLVVVPMNPERLDVLASQNLTPHELIGDRLEVLEQPGAPLAAVSPQQAGAAAGYDVRAPAYMATGVSLVGIDVLGQQRVRVTADAQRLRQVMAALAITDLDVPDGLDGQVVALRVPPIVTMRYERGGMPAAQFRQAEAPEITLPQDVDLAALGEIGLRVLGLPPVEAAQFAQAIDWHTTLLVPLPRTVQSMKQVSIGGHRGVAIERLRAPGDERAFEAAVTRDGRRWQQNNALLWSGGGRVYAMEGPLAMTDMLRMAESVK